MTSDDSEAKARVLIIEDNIDTAKELERAYRTSHKRLHFDVTVVSSESKAEPLIKIDFADIYIVDLELPEFEAAPSEKVGERLVARLVQSSNGGIIIHTGMLRTDRDDFLWGGVDDYIQKSVDSPNEVVAKTFAVWRRVRRAQDPGFIGRSRPRTFRLGKWIFRDGQRSLNSDSGEIARLSPTELAFVQYLCTVDTEIDRREFNTAVLAREAYQEDKRIDNL